jgi:TolB-like protein/Tfp pilus assembly protein PilF
LTPPGVDRVVRKCLQKDPEARWQSAPDVADELRWLAGGSGAIGAPAAVEGTRRRPGIAWLAGLAAVAVLSLVAVSVALGVGGLRERLVGLFAGRSGAPAAAIRSLAVLPVENYSGDPGQEFFADGMTDALIAGLAQIKAIKVISRTSVMQYKDAKRPLPQIARELGVDGIVEASVMRAGGRVQITAQLLQAREDRHLWAGTYAREMTDVVTLQAELVQAIAHEIQSQLTPQESERLKTARAVDPEVYDATLRGKALLEQGMREEQFQRAVALFQQAVDRDPNYAPAWAGLADSLWSMATAGMEFVAPGDVRARAVAAAEKALELDETLPEAHKARAGVAWDGEWDVAKAKQEFERALELRPGYAAAEYLYAGIFFLQERFDEALRHMNHASELDPLSPWNDFDHVAWWIYQGRGEEAVQEAEAARRRNPTVPHLAAWAAYAHIILGQPDQAAADMEAALKLFSPNRPSSDLGLLGCTYGLAGRRADAQTILSEMERSSRERYISPLGLAWVNAGLGRMDEAFRLLDQALEERTPYLSVCTRTDPSANVFRHDPRWKPFISRVRALVRLPPDTPDLYQ